MATQFLRINPDGSKTFKIRYSRRGKAQATRNWTSKPGWTDKTIERELSKAELAFIEEVKAGAVMTRTERKEAEAESRAAEEAVYSVSRYAYEVFLPTKEITIKENTRLHYVNILKNHIIPVIGSSKITDVKPHDIQMMLLDMRKNGLSFKTTKEAYSVCNMLFDMAYMGDIIPNNIIDKVKLPPRSKEDLKTGPQAFTAEELNHIRKLVELEPLKWELFVKLLIDTGCRRAEANGLKWSAVNFDDGTIKIDTTLNFSKDRGVYESTPKSGQLRIIDISPEIVTLLKRQHAEQVTEAMNRASVEAAVVGHPVRTEEPVFVFSQDNSVLPMFPTSVNRFFVRFSKKHNLEGFHPHALRHSFASVAITHGADIVSVSQKLGHSDATTTLAIYSHSNPEAIRTAGNIFRDALASNE